MAGGRTLIVAGDTNLLSTKSDKNIPINLTNSAFAGNELLQSVCRDFYLSDAYRKKNPLGKSYLCYDNRGSATRIDRIFLQCPLRNHIVSAQHKECPLSDH